MVNTLLCQSDIISKSVTAAADLLGGIGTEFAASKECTPAHTQAVPFLKLHGMEDEPIPYEQVPGKEVLVDNVEFLGAQDTVAVRARANGCGPEAAGDEKQEAGAKMVCRDLCAKAEPKSPPAKLCGMIGVGHTTDDPFPGFVYQQAFSFFEQQPNPADKWTAVKPVDAPAAGVKQSAGGKVPEGMLSMSADKDAPAAGNSSSKATGGDAQKGGSNVNVAAVAGGVAGGVVAGAGAIGAALYGSIRKRRKYMESLERLPYNTGDVADDTKAGKDQAADMVVVAGDVAGALRKA